jgi:hypothetical protein
MHRNLQWLADLMSTVTTKEEVRTAEQNQRAYLNVAMQAIVVARQAIEAAAQNGDIEPPFVDADTEYLRYHLEQKIKRLDEDGGRA